MIQVTVHKIKGYVMEHYDLSAAKLIGSILIPWKECAITRDENRQNMKVSWSGFKLFNENVYAHEDSFYDEDVILGNIIGRVGFVEYHQ